jgi:hypothetical protein
LAQNFLDCLRNLVSAFNDAPHELRERHSNGIADRLELKQIQTLFSLFVFGNVGLRLTDTLRYCRLRQTSVYPHLSK